MSANSFFYTRKIKFRRIASTEKPHISHSMIAESNTAKDNEVFVNEEALALQQLVGDDLDALLARDARSNDFFNEIVEGIIERAKEKLAFSSCCMSHRSMNKITIKVSGIFSYAHYIPPKYVLLSQDIFMIPLNKSGYTFINPE